MASLLPSLCHIVGCSSTSAPRCLHMSDSWSFQGPCGFLVWILCGEVGMKCNMQEKMRGSLWGSVLSTMWVLGAKLRSSGW